MTNCPGCGAIMLITNYRQIDIGHYYMRQVCSICRVIRDTLMEVGWENKIK